MIAQRFRPIGWVAGVATAATALYLVSLQVAAERGKLEAVEKQIADAKHELRRLQTELGTRASLRQLEVWNGDVLSLSAPKASQFVAGAAQLVALDLKPGEVTATPPALLAEATTAPPAPATAKFDVPVVAAKARPLPVAVPTHPVKGARVQAVAMLDPRTMADLGRVASAERHPRP